jgi:uncharacterized membrane protein
MGAPIKNYQGNHGFALGSLESRSNFNYSQPVLRVLCVLISLAGVFVPGAALAKFSIINNTNKVLKVSILYYTGSHFSDGMGSESPNWTSRGWYEVGLGQTSEVFSGQADKGTLWLHLSSNGENFKLRRDVNRKSANMCISNRPFKSTLYVHEIKNKKYSFKSEGQDQRIGSCEAVGGYLAPFYQHQDNDSLTIN